MGFTISKMRPLLLVLSLNIILAMLTACSQSPVALVKQSAGELVMIDRVQIKRERQFSVPTTSQVGLVINPLSAKALAVKDETLLPTFINEGLHTFNHVFSTVRLLDKTEEKLPPSSVDFIIRASLLDAVTHVYTGAQQQEADDQQSAKKDRKNIELFSRIRPYHALIKLELLDARTSQALDVAIIKSRSGSLGSLKFKGLIRQSFSAYSKSITSTYPSTF